MTKVVRLPARSRVTVADTWDLSPMCESDVQWEELFQKLDKQIAGYDKFRGKLGDGPSVLARLLKFDHEFDRLAERIGGYASLKASEDQANSTYQGMIARFQNRATRANQAASYIRPEILALPKKTLDEYLKSKELKPFKLVLERIVRFKPYSLSAREEEILAMQGE